MDGPSPAYTTILRFIDSITREFLSEWFMPEVLVLSAPFDSLNLPKMSHTPAYSQTRLGRRPSFCVFPRSSAAVVPQTLFEMFADSR